MPRNAQPVRLRAYSGNSKQRGCNFIETADLPPNSVCLPWPPKELSPNARTHWATKARIAKRYRATCHILAKQARLQAGEGPIHLVVTFAPPDRRHRDDDNCTGAFKAGRDGVADAMGVDDSRFRVTASISTEPVKGGCVVLTILDTQGAADAEAR